jgi:hypothetical protein
MEHPARPSGARVAPFEMALPQSAKVNSEEPKKPHKETYSIRPRTRLLRGDNQQFGKLIDRDQQSLRLRRQLWFHQWAVLVPWYLR